MKMNNDKQHRENTKYKQWEDGMYVMLDDLDCDYELALVEGSLRGSVYSVGRYVFDVFDDESFYGVLNGEAGLWFMDGRFKTKLTRAQALYIATGDADI
jgi:hypothetical protein